MARFKKHARPTYTSSLTRQRGSSPCSSQQLSRGRSSSHHRSAGSSSPSQHRSAESSSSPQRRLAGSSSSSQRRYVDPPRSDPIAHVGSATEDDLHEDFATEMDNEQMPKNQRQSRGSWTVNVVDVDGHIRQTHLKAGDVFTFSDGRRVMVEWNDENQPIGDSAGLLAGFLGSLASNLEHFPITFTSWKKIPPILKKNVYNERIKVRIDVDDNGPQNKFILKSLGRKWREYKNKLFNDFYDWKLSFEQKCLKHPERIRRRDWETFITHKTSERAQEISRVNSTNRDKQDIVHTLGSKSAARKRAELEQLQKEVEDGCSDNEAFLRVFGKEHPGRVRGLGAGVTPTQFLGGSSSRDPQFHSLQSEVATLKAEREADKAELAAMRAEREAERKAMRAEREAEREAREAEREANKVFQEDMRNQMAFFQQLIQRNQVFPGTM